MRPELLQHRSQEKPAWLLGIMLVLIVCTCVKTMLKRFPVHWLPDACAFILVGAIVMGGILRLIDRSVVCKISSVLTTTCFYKVCYPRLSFRRVSAVTNWPFDRSDLFPILDFASLGTAFSAIAIGLITHHVSQ
jgi:NhaP-type Na+/H+ or K+/H+ antiporter